MLKLSAVVPEASPACQKALTDLSGEVVPHLEDVAVEMASAIHASNNTLTDDLQDETQLMCLANITLVVQMLREGKDPAGTHPPAEAFRYGKELVHRGLAVEGLLGIYRVGHGTFWGYWLERMREGITNREVLAEAVAYCSAWTFAYVDAVSGPLATAFGAEKERWARSAVAQRADEVREILQGWTADEAATSQRLRYELAHRHMAYVVWNDGTHALGSGDVVLWDLAAAVGHALGCASPLVVGTEPGLTSGWASLPAGDIDPVALTNPLMGTLTTGGVRVAFGKSAHGIDGFRRSHEEALTARKVANLVKRPPGSRVRFDDVALTALLTSDLVEARRFVVRELGPLAVDTDAMRRLVATLRVFLEEGASFVRAARRLSVHENTVAYRVKRASDLLGHPADEGVLRIHVALMLCEVLRRAEEDSEP